MLLKCIMWAKWLIFLVLLPGLVAQAQAADICNPVNLIGPSAKPTASLGRISFDGQGSLSGTASAIFRGLLLGNPVTGSH
jgi:hypothetical protein